MRARVLTFWEKVHPPHLSCVNSGVWCNVSGVTYHVSGVTGHMSYVICHMSLFCVQSIEASQWRVCYQRGVPCLFFWHLGQLPSQWHVLYFTHKSKKLHNSKTSCQASRVLCSTVQYSSVQYAELQSRLLQKSRVESLHYTTLHYCQQSKPTTGISHARKYSG